MQNVIVFFWFETIALPDHIYRWLGRRRFEPTDIIIRITTWLYRTSEVCHLILLLSFDYSVRSLEQDGL